MSIKKIFLLIYEKYIQKVISFSLVKYYTSKVGIIINVNYIIFIFSMKRKIIIYLYIY